MHGLGNDFMVVDATQKKFDLSKQQIRQLSDRHLGVGFDQLLVVEPSADHNIDFVYRIYNADGHEVSQCGNGARCFARFVTDKGLINKDNISVLTNSGKIILNLEKEGMVRVNMGIPDFEPKNIPFQAESRSSSYNLDIGNETVNICAVSIGNPHAVILVDDINQAPVGDFGPHIETLPIFPEGVNVGFMQIINRNEIKLRVYERGSGETQACGSGACASVACGRMMGKLNATVTAHLQGGDLQLTWEGESEPMYMTGTATSVYEGQISL